MLLPIAMETPVPTPVPIVPGNGNSSSLSSSTLSLYKKRKGDPDKVWCNETAASLYRSERRRVCRGRRRGGRSRGRGPIWKMWRNVQRDKETVARVALALDDANFQSVSSIVSGVPGCTAVHIAQHDRRVYRAMVRKLESDVEQDDLKGEPGPESESSEFRRTCTGMVGGVEVSVVLGDYSLLNKHVVPGTVVMDHADFCGTHVTNFATLRDRFVRGLFDPELAILRITVCQRGLGMAKEEFLDDVEQAVYGLAQGTGYTIELATMRKLYSARGQHRRLAVDFPPDMRDSCFFHSGKIMYTAWCIVRGVGDGDDVGDGMAGAVGLFN